MHWMACFGIKVNTAAAIIPHTAYSCCCKYPPEPWIVINASRSEPFQISPVPSCFRKLLFSFNNMKLWIWYCIFLIFSFESLALSNTDMWLHCWFWFVWGICRQRGKKTQNNTDFILQPHPVFPSLCRLLTAANKIWFVTVGLSRVRIPAALDMVYMHWWSSLPTFPTSLSSAAVL